MEPKKMSPEELAQLNAGTERALSLPGRPHGGTVLVRDLLAHIAALEAERSQLDHVTKELDAVCPGSANRGLTPSGRVLWMSATHAIDVEDAQKERDALRERVRALEHELEQERTLSAHLQERTNTAERRLAAIRQRQGEVRDSIAELDEHCQSTVLEVLNTVVGEDATGAVERWKQEASATVGSCARELGMPPPASPEPSTAEAFATLRRLLQLHPDRPLRHASYAALSLLKLRMGAQDAALRLAITAHEAPWPETERNGLCVGCGAWTPARHPEAHDHKEGCTEEARCHALRNPDWDSIRAALTDAPRVVTLEEVITAMHESWASGIDIESRAELDVLQRLAALRKG